MIATRARHPARLGLGVASLALAILLLVRFQAPQDAEPASSGSSEAASSGAGSTAGPGAASGSGVAAGTTPSGASTASGTVDGTVVNTRYGPVEVRITVAGGKVIAATAIELPSGGRSSAISSYAAPILSTEAVTAQSASIDLVSGATYTSEAYAQSLQAALDQAGI